MYIMSMAHSNTTNLNTHSFLDPDALELVLDDFPLLLGFGYLLVCLLSFGCPFQLVSFFTWKSEHALLVCLNNIKTSKSPAKTLSQFGVWQGCLRSRI